MTEKIQVVRVQSSKAVFVQCCLNIKNVQIDETIDISDGIDLTKFDPVIYA